MIVFLLCFPERKFGNWFMFEDMRAAYHRMSYDHNHNIFSIHSKQLDKTLKNCFVSIFKTKMFVRGRH